MFNNPFLKKDSLLEAVKAAQADGEMRRQAEAIVNEEFGVYSRQAVVREDLAAYDAALKDIYEALKGNQDKIDLNKNKRIDAGDFKMLRNRKKHMEEGNDGNLANNYPPYDKVTRGDVIAGATGKDQMGGKRKVKVTEKKMWEGMMDPKDPSVQGSGDVTSEPKHVRPSNPDRIKNMKDPRDPSVQGSGDVTSGDKPASIREEKINEAASRKDFRSVAELIKGHESQEKRNELATHHAGIFAKQNPRFNHEKFHAAAGSTAHQQKKMDEAKYSAKAARHGEDIGKPGKSFKMIAKKAGERYGSEEKGKKVAGAILKKIRAKHMKEENIQELSAFGSAFAAARKSGQSNFSFGGKSFNTKLASPGATAKPTAPKPTPTLGRSETAAAARTSGSSLPSMAASTPAAKPSVDKYSFAPGANKTSPVDAVKPDAPKPAVDKYSFGQNIVNPPKAEPAPTPAPASDLKPVDTSKMSDSPVAPKPADLGNELPPSRQSLSADVNANRINRRLSNIQESVQVGDNKYRIV